MNLNLQCPINQLSYGIVGVNVLKSLTDIGLDVSLFPIGMELINKPRQFEAMSNELKTNRYDDYLKIGLNNSLKFDANAPSLRIWHQHDMSHFVGRGTHIGFPIFELDKFTDEEIHNLKACDELFVCTNWADDILHENQISVPTSIVPLGVDSEIFYPEENPPEKDNVIFLITGKWEVRKGHDIIPDLFDRTFEEDDKVELWVMCDNIFNSDEQNKEWEDKFKNMRLSSKVKFIPRRDNQEEVAKIYQKVDCLIALSRAEGWNLPILENMACGNWIISTACSGHNHYCTSNNSIRLSSRTRESANDGVWFHGHGNWMSFNERILSDAIYYLKHMYRDIQGHSGDSEYYGEYALKTAQEYTWDNTADKIAERIAEINNAD